MSLNTAIVNHHLDQALSSALFRKAERQSRFLRFALQSPGATIKEFDIAVSVYDRRPDYDPRMDPIVRVEAARLRARLREYYEVARLAPGRTDMPIIFITGHGDVATSVQAMKAGAFESLMKPFKHDVPWDAIREGLDRSRLSLAREMETSTLRNRYASLTRRERQVLALVVSGLLNKQVAGELSISEIPVKAHRRRVMQKMQAHPFADLVRIAARLGPHRARNSASSADVAA